MIIIIIIIIIILILRFKGLKSVATSSSWDPDSQSNSWGNNRYFFQRYGSDIKKWKHNVYTALTFH